MSTTNKLLPHFIHSTRTSAQAQIKVVANTQLRSHSKVIACLMLMRCIWLCNMLLDVTVLACVVSEPTDAGKNTKAALKCFMRCVRTPPSAKISSLHNSTHAPEIEINPPKTACGFPCSGVMKNKTKKKLKKKKKKKKKKVTYWRNPLTLWKAFVNVLLQINYTGWPLECSQRRTLQQ